MAVVFEQPRFPLWFDNIEAVSIAAANFDPIVTAAAHDVGRYTRNGFGVKNGTETAGTLRAITLEQFRANRSSTVDWYTGGALVPATIYLNGGDWCLTPVVKIFAANDQTYPSTGLTNINIGWIL